MKIMKEKIKSYLKKSGVSLFSEAKLFYAMNLRHRDKKRFSAAIHSLMREGYLKKEKSLYKVSIQKTITAVIDRVLSTFGFAEDENGKEYFIPGSYLFGAIPGDKVELIPIRGEDAAKVSEIIEYSTRLFSGEVILYGNNAFISSSELGKDPYPIEIENPNPGDKVLAEIVHRDKGRLRLRAVQNFFECSRAADAAELYLKQLGVPMEFSEEVISEARAMSLLPVDSEGRVDLRNKPIFTIDSEHSKDLDDAILVEKEEDGYLLTVAIADVSHYVAPYSALDKEAFSRGTSIYYADKVIPMLPKELSNGICSLNEGEDRFALVCETHLDRVGEIVSFEFKKAIIRSRVKGVYREINELLEGSNNPELKKKYKEVSTQFPLITELYEKLKTKREERKVIDFETAESFFITDENGKAIDISLRERGTAECMIEEFMIIANRSAALLSKKASLPFLYRVHDKPSPDKASELLAFLIGLGVSLPPKADLTNNSVLYEIEASLENSPVKFIADKQILRAMQKARYKEINTGHFGLALSDYSHFTSPIRRYPDLFIHRVISDYLSAPDKSLTKKYAALSEEAAIQSSNTERRAVTAERDISDKYSAEFALSNIGRHYKGIISAVTSNGFFCLLPNSLEGFVDLKTKRNFVLSEGLMLRNPVSGECYKIGEDVEIEIKGADVFSGKIDFSLIKD